MDPWKIAPCKIDPCKIAPFKMNPCEIGPCKMDPCKIGPCKMDPCQIAPCEMDPCKITHLPKCSFAKMFICQNVHLQEIPCKSAPVPPGGTLTPSYAE